MKFSFQCYPHDSVAEILATAEAADSLGYDTFYLTDSTYRRDPWVLFGAIAQRTKRIRMGPKTVRLLITDPLIVARELATLDEMSGGRVDGGLGLGYAGTLSLLTTDDVKRPTIPFLREAIGVIRHALANPTIDHKGRFFNYRITGVPMRAQAVQKPLPLFYGAGHGPRAMELAGELLDGLHVSACKRSVLDFGFEHFRKGAERAGRDWRSLDRGAEPIVVCSEDGKAARDVARIWTTYYLGRGPLHPALQPEFDALGLTSQLLDSIKAAWDAGDIAGAAARVPQELADLTTIAGTPDECLVRLRDDVMSSGINHLVFAIADQGHLRMLLGSAADSINIPTVAQQLALIQKHVLPGLKAVAA